MHIYVYDYKLEIYYVIKVVYLAQPIIFTNIEPVIKRRVLTIIKKKQDGKCHYCDLKFTANDIIVSCGTRRRNYYHKTCAERLHII